MEVSDLVGIGKLGKQEPDGFYHIQLSQSYKTILDQLEQCFLIFSSNRVFYVTVVETKTKGTRTYLRFLEDGVAEECKKHPKVIVAIDPNDFYEDDDEDDISYLLGYDIFYQDNIIGRLTDAMINRMQSVLVISLNDERELLVPNVSQYVSAIDKQSQIVYLQNLDELLEVCTST